MTKRRGLFPETPEVLPMVQQPYERALNDTEYGWATFLRFRDLPADLSLTEFLDTVPQEMRALLGDEPRINGWEMRKNAYWQHVATQMAAQVSARAAKTNILILDQLNTSIENLSKRVAKGNDDEALALLLAHLAAAAQITQRISSSANGGIRVNINNDMRRGGGGEKGPAEITLGPGFHTPPGE